MPATSNVTPGTSFDIDISVSDVADLYAFQFSVAYNPDVLSPVTVLPGDLLGTSFFPGTLDETTGLISFISDTLTGPGPGVTGSGSLATLRFLASANGSSALPVSDVILLDSVAGEIPVTVANGAVNVVPEPSSLLFGGAGLALLLGLRIRRAG
jgi:hypothetical protein